MGKELTVMKVAAAVKELAAIKVGSCKGKKLCTARKKFAVIKVAAAGKVFAAIRIAAPMQAISG